MNNNHNFIIDNEKIGEGTYGYVYKCKKMNDDGKEYIAKMCNKGIEVARKEYENIIDINNINLLKFYDFEVKDGQTYLIFEFCNGFDLDYTYENYILKYNKFFSPEINQKILKDVVNGLSCLHRNDIQHNDIKLNNILVKYNNQIALENIDILDSTIKISDFGISKSMCDSSIINKGTLPYLDPESLHNNGKSKLERDIWALGIVAFKLFFKSHPFYPPNEENNIIYENLVKNIDKGIIKFEVDEGFEIFIEELCFVDACLKYNCINRYNIDFLQYCPYLTKNIDEFQKINKQNYKVILPKDMIKGNFIIIDIKKKDRLFKLLNIYTF
jgi:serine/threonine protein kinase